MLQTLKYRPNPAPTNTRHVYPFGSVIPEFSYKNVVENDKAGYRYGFNTQEMDDEVAGKGNSYTAEFWQYDSRLGRRFNLDPRPNPGSSSYSCFANNPIFNIDVKGDTTHVYNEKGQFIFTLNDNLSNTIIYVKNTQIEKLLQTNQNISNLDGTKKELYTSVFAHSLRNAENDWVLGIMDKSTLDELSKYRTLTGERLGLLYADLNTKIMKVWECTGCRGFSNASSPGAIDKSNSNPVGGFYIPWHSHPDKNGAFDATKPTPKADYEAFWDIMDGKFNAGGPAIIVSKNTITIYRLANFTFKNVNNNFYVPPYSGVSTKYDDFVFGNKVKKDDREAPNGGNIRFNYKNLTPVVLWLK